LPNLQVLLNGLANGAGFALVGAAFAFLLLTTRTLSISLGAVYVLAPYGVLTGLRLGVPPSVAVTGAVALAALAAIVCEVVIHWPLECRSASAGAHLIGSLGAYLALVQVGVLLWGPDRLVLNNALPEVYVLGAIRITQPQILGFVCSVAASGVFLATIHWSRIGLSLRALGSNPILLSTLGRNVQVYRIVAFGIAGALVGLAACLAAYDVGFDPNVGLSAVLIGFASTVLGGTSSLWGPIVAGIIIGLLRAFIGWTFGTEWVDAATFVVLVLSLVSLPRGISSGFGPTRRFEARS
jgi:branched-chain amino acid transport system permease protein